MRISDWSSDVCSSDLSAGAFQTSAKPTSAGSPIFGQARKSRPGRRSDNAFPQASAASFGERKTTAGIGEPPRVGREPAATIWTPRRGVDRCWGGALESDGSAANQPAHHPRYERKSVV